MHRRTEETNGSTDRCWLAGWIIYHHCQNRCQIEMSGRPRDDAAGGRVRTPACAWAAPCGGGVRALSSRHQRRHACSPGYCWFGRWKNVVVGRGLPSPQFSVSWSPGNHYPKTINVGVLGLLALPPRDAAARVGPLVYAFRETSWYCRVAHPVVHLALPFERRAAKLHVSFERRAHKRTCVYLDLL
jgi:hypothetical protein